MKKKWMFILCFIFLIGFISADECHVVAKNDCGGEAILGLYDLSNAHAQIWPPSVAEYDYVLCCDFVSYFNCDGDDKIVGLYQLSNSHVQIPELSNYPNEVCYEGITCGSFMNSCPAETEAILSLSESTNAHIGDENAYPLKICCRYDGVPVRSCNNNGVCELSIGESTANCGDCYCGDGLCEPSVEDCSSCPGDCGVCPGGCDITEASWIPESGDDGQQVILNLEANGGCNNQEISFEIFERDGFWPFYTYDSVQNALTDPPTTRILAGDGNNQYYWYAEWMNFDGGEDEEVEYVFEVTVLSSSDVERSNVLTVSPETWIPPAFCDDIVTCSDYDQANCTRPDNCSLAHSTNIGSGCREETYCTWNTNTNMCDTAHDIRCEDPSGGDVNVGLCVYSEDSSADSNGCEDGYLFYTYNATWIWGEGNNYTASGDGYIPLGGGFYAWDPNHESEQCIDGSETLVCPAKIELGFFDWYNIVLAVLIIWIIYYFYKKRKK